jgi:hypothetical protein
MASARAPPLHYQRGSRRPNLHRIGSQRQLRKDFRNASRHSHSRRYVLGCKFNKLPPLVNFSVGTNTSVVFAVARSSSMCGFRESVGRVEDWNRH